jgi:hypothetical protein
MIPREYRGVTDLLEWWPEYNSGPLWCEGQNVPLDQLGLPDDLVRNMKDWNGSYADEKLPIEGPGDPVWLAQGHTVAGRGSFCLGRNVHRHRLRTVVG